MSESYIGFLEGIKRRKMVTSSFLPEPQNDISRCVPQPSQMESSVDSDYSNFAKNLEGAASSSKIARSQKEGIAQRLKARLLELGLSDDELWIECNNLEKMESELKCMSIGEANRIFEGKSTILPEEGRRAIRRRHLQITELGNELDGVKSTQQLDESMEAESESRSSKSRGQIANDGVIGKDSKDKKAKFFGKKLFHCKRCPKMFSSKYHATNHAYAHMEKEELDKLQVHYEECPTCNKIFFHKSHFKDHRLIHSGIKPHICGVCSMAFTQKSTLAKHANVHLNPKQKQEMKSGWKHVCYFCDQKFQAPSKLSAHFPSHTKERAFCCNVCKKTFTFQGSLTSHKKSVHLGLRYQCCRCSKSFSSSCYLKRHNENVHK